MAFTNCFQPKLSIPVLPCNKAMHFNNVVVTSTHSSPRCPFPPQSLVAPNYKHLNVAVKNKEDQWRLWCSYDEFNSAAPFELQLLVQKFFYGIKHGDEILLKEILSSDCEFEDIVFNIQPGRENIIAFLREVKEAMGGGTHFDVEPVVETYNTTAYVRWHLERNGREIPFTRSYYLFECEENDNGELLIRKITGVKPGELGLSILKNLVAARSIDEFPQEAEVKKKEDQLKLCCSCDEANSVDLQSLIGKFMRGLNKADEKSFKNVLSLDFTFQDIQPGRKNMIAFLGEVKEATGGNILFDEVKLPDEPAGDERENVIVNCYLEWHKIEIPYTRSCYLFECCKNDEDKEEDEDDKEKSPFLIRKITGVAGKPASKSILKFLKAAWIIFDNFPEEAEEFLSKTKKNW